jgi:hypothetical protein
MRDAKYFRARAEQCLKIASLMSDRTAANRLRVEAAENIGRAVALEARSDPPVSNSSARPTAGDSRRTSPTKIPNQANRIFGKRIITAASSERPSGKSWGLTMACRNSCRTDTLLMQLNEHQHRGKTGR